MIDELVTALPLPAVFIDRQERIAAVNEAATALLGPGAVGRHHITVLRQPLLLDAIETAFRTGERRVAAYTSTVARRDMTWSATVSPMPKAGGLLLVFEDRTEMAEASQMRRDFVANVSHELKTPLTAISGFIETLRGAARNDPAAQDRFLGIMESEATRMNRLIRDLLSLNRVESEERVRPKGKADLAGIVGAVMRNLGNLSDGEGVTLTAEGVEAPLLVPGDPDQLTQVVANLTENAIKYSGRGSTVTLRLTSEDANPMVLGPAAILSVSDTGEGFDPTHIPRLTERFYRVDTHRSRAQGGTGLGLAIVKHIVNRHRGRLRIESAPGQGSRFSVILPRNT
ncbi:ATP-binding protein [Kangsaoukella pontilimi]|uniref:ATP-binding protein n=1 Tax=Kangsaoukella pontilimi TaxID=2691042 RepID=UPI0029CA13D8|nr:ATP-binding protein [Kangsaoukella pontilimi]